MNCVIVRRECRYRGWFTVDAYDITHDCFDGGTMSVRRELLERGDSVGVVLYDPDAWQVLLLEQFRVGPMARGDRPWLVEIVAGVIDPGETAEEAARREALEEAGYAVGRLRRLGAPRWYPSPGACSEQVTLFLAEVARDRPARDDLGVPEEGEDIRRRWVAVEEAMAMVADGRINSALPIIALQRAFGVPPLVGAAAGRGEP
ncbi:MAG: NUDIX hydrolase [Zetaproteobacteria bacterium]|nr:MAG: NUDIX hydrolase [Zetaproteobacteria bacterium]